jgi:transposase InsO family protein
LGLTAGLVPPRVDGRVKAGLLELIDHAGGEGGWSLRRPAAALGIDHVRVLRWQARAAAGQLDDLRPGPEQAASGEIPGDDDRLPVLAAVSGNGPQMTSKATAAFMAGARIAQHFGRPSTPNDQAWVESFFGHLKGEFPHLEKTAGAGELQAELDRLRLHCNTVRLHEGLGYVTPDDEHHGRGGAIRAARRAGLDTARTARVAARRALREDHP